MSNKTKVIRLKEDIVTELLHLNPNINESVTELLQSNKVVTPLSVTKCNTDVTDCNTINKLEVTQLNRIEKQLNELKDFLMIPNNVGGGGDFPTNIDDNEKDFLNKYMAGGLNPILKEKAIKQFGSVRVTLLLNSIKKT